MNTDDAIRQRRTEKILSERDLPTVDCQEIVNEILALAGQAPFHRACEESHRQSGSLDGIEPWRFHVLGASACRKLRQKVPCENAGKIPAMLAAADALIMATWLPSPSESPSTDDELSFAVTLTNMEHIAAVAAAIQTLLLAATARGISNYWSSGGVLRSRTVLDLLGIAPNEIPLGAIFLFPKEFGNAELVRSKLRDLRTPPQSWSRWVTVS